MNEFGRDATQQFILLDDKAENIRTGREVTSQMRGTVFRTAAHFLRELQLWNVIR